MKQCLYTGVATVDREEIMPNNLSKSKHREGEQIGLEKEVEVLIFELKSMGQEELSPYADVDNLNRGSHSNGMGRSPAVLRKRNNCLEHMEDSDKSNFDENDNK
ncbi:hypothetical protein GOBAR_DD00536 [Gossypium barbadense]|nr:hypothetical protein GOBAR_DD00536 [Gossypium barbadense]